MSTAAYYPAVELDRTCAVLLLVDQQGRQDTPRRLTH
jgi:hypothetical protein